MVGRSRSAIRSVRRVPVYLCNGAEATWWWHRVAALCGGGGQGDALIIIVPSDGS